MRTARRPVARSIEESARDFALTSAERIDYAQSIQMELHLPVTVDCRSSSYPYAILCRCATFAQRVFMRTLVVYLHDLATIDADRALALIVIQRRGSARQTTANRRRGPIDDRDIRENVFRM